MPAARNSNASWLLLIGNIALQSAEDVFRTVSATLGDQVKRIHGWRDRAAQPLGVLATPHSRTQRRIRNRSGRGGARHARRPRRSRACAAGSAMRRPSKASRHRRECGCAPASRPSRMGLQARSAMPKWRRNGIESFGACAMRASIPAGVKFQVSLPTTAAFLNAHVVSSQHAVIEPIYRARLLAEVDQMVEIIAPSDLAIQWDVSTEMAQWEGVRHAYFGDVRPSGR